MKNENQIRTGLWTKTSEKGVQYGNGKIKIDNKEYKVVLFKIGEKKTEKSPDFNLILEELKDDKKKETDEQVYADFGEITEIKDSDIAF